MEKDDREYQAMLSMSQAAQEAADAMKKLSAAVQNFRLSLAELMAARFPGKTPADEASQVEAVRMVARASRSSKNPPKD